MRSLSYILNDYKQTNRQTESFKQLQAIIWINRMTTFHSRAISMVEIESNLTEVVCQLIDLDTYLFVSIR